MPSGEEGSIKSITISGKRTELARAGDRADVTLSDIDAGVLGAGVPNHTLTIAAEPYSSCSSPPAYLRPLRICL